MNATDSRPFCAVFEEDLGQQLGTRHYERTVEELERQRISSS